MAWYAGWLPTSLRYDSSNSFEPDHLKFGSHCVTEKVYSAYLPAPFSVGNSAAENPVPAAVMNLGLRSICSLCRMSVVASSRYDAKYTTSGLAALTRWSSAL